MPCYTHETTVTRAEPERGKGKTLEKCDALEVEACAAAAAPCFKSSGCRLRRRARQPAVTAPVI